MIKALLVITGITGMSPYTVDMDTMIECQNQATIIRKQAPNDVSLPKNHRIYAFCLPRREKPLASDKFKNVLELFVDTVERIREREDYCFERSFDEECKPDVLR